LWSHKTPIRTGLAELTAKHHPGFRSIELRERAGKGGATRIGVYEAAGRYKLFMDADLATPLRHLDDVHKFMQREGDIAIAVRHIQATHTGVRKFISEFGNILVRVLLTPGIGDTQCGFKVFESEVAHQLFGRQQITGWAFDMELLAVARKLKYKVELIEADDWHDPKTEGLVGDSNAKAAIESGVDMLKIKWRLITGQYKRISYHHTPL